MGRHAADASRTAFSRQVFAGLASEDWGTLTLGRQYNQGFLYFGAIGPFGNGFGLASPSLTFGNSLVRYDNLAKYETPVVGGAQAAIGQDRGGRIAAGNTNLGELGVSLPVANARHMDGFPARSQEYRMGLLHRF